jgi:hypothetical protein
VDSQASRHFPAFLLQAKLFEKNPEPTGCARSDWLAVEQPAGMPPESSIASTSRDNMLTVAKREWVPGTFLGVKAAGACC